MNTPPDITPLDLMALALAECKRFDQFAVADRYEIFASQRLVRELLREAVEVAVERTA